VTTERSALPTYAQLLSRTDAPAGSAWGVFGDNDEIGTLNHLTSERVRSAAACILTGETFNLDLPLDAFNPALIPSRKPLQHHLFANNPYHRDEYVDSFYTQNGSQLDGFRHIGHPDAGFYNNADPHRFVAGDPFLGINKFTDHGIVGRGVLIDVDRYVRSLGSLIDHRGGEAIPVDTLKAAALHQQVDLRHGDILLIRTGWLNHHFTENNQSQDNTQPIKCSGLKADQRTVEWLWDNQFSVVATDNFAVEAWPASPNSPFISKAEQAGSTPTTGHTGLMHRALIPLLGMVLGELWNLDDLADKCAADGRWDCMVTASPLNLTGGAGSPANAIAIR
jgi:kynurenine formamidase